MDSHSQPTSSTEPTAENGTLHEQLQQVEVSDANGGGGRPPAVRRLVNPSGEDPEGPPNTGGGGIPTSFLDTRPPESKLPSTGSVAELRNAMHLAKEAHESIGHIRVMGQDLGKSYFDTHVVRVIKLCPPWAKPAASLHDVIEDCGNRDMWLARMQQVVSRDTLEAVHLLTQWDGQDYQVYIRAIANASGIAGQIARTVKLCDLMDNLTGYPEGSRREDYIWAMSMVSQVISQRGEHAWGKYLTK